MIFTKKKFQSFTEEKKHKKCAELLQQIYTKNLSIDLYNDIALWMGLSPLLNHSKEEISNRYHFHLKKAHLHIKEHNLLPSVKRYDKEKAKPLFPIAIVLDNIRSAHNVGSIIRTTEAFSLGTLYFSGSTPQPNHNQVIKTSMGCANWIKWNTFSSFNDLPSPIIAFETATCAINLYDFTFPTSFSFILGNEEYGIKKEFLQKADFIVEIPLRGRKNSLNVANTYAIIANEIQRQQYAKYNSNI